MVYFFGYHAQIKADKYTQIQQIDEYEQALSSVNSNLDIDEKILEIQTKLENFQGYMKSDSGVVTQMDMLLKILDKDRVTRLENSNTIIHENSILQRQYLIVYNGTPQELMETVNGINISYLPVHVESLRWNKSDANFGITEAVISLYTEVSPNE